MCVQLQAELFCLCIKKDDHVFTFMWIVKLYLSFVVVGLYGANNWEAAICDQIIDSVSDVFTALIGYMFTAKTEEEKVLNIY